MNKILENNRKNSTCPLFAYVLIGAFAVLLSGCMTYQPPPQERVRAPALPPPQVDQSSPDTLSYGMVTGRVKKNETTQQDLLELFGGPSTMTTDREGTEVWMYDKTTTTTSSSYSSSDSYANKSDAAVMAGFFGLSVPLGVGAGGVKSGNEGASAAQGRNSVTHSVKTLTFIVKFNPDRTVKDYSVRQASY